MRRRLASDDVMSGYRRHRLSGNVPDYPDEIIYGDYVFSPHVQDGIDRIADNVVHNAELLGFDIDDPEMMGAFFSKTIKKIKTAIQKRRAKKSTGGAKTVIPSVSVAIPGKGSAQVGPGGISWVGTTPASTGSVSVRTGAGVTKPTTAGTAAELLKNPMVIGAAVGIPLLLLMMSKKKGGK